MNDKVRPPACTVAPSEHHASCGIGKPYPKEYREQVMFLHDNYPGVLQSPAVIAAQDIHVHAVNRTINRWLRRRERLGHVRPYKRSGNRRAEREINGQALIDLALYRTIRCKAFGYEVLAFLFNRNPDVAPYSASQLSRAEKKLDLTTVAASTTANAAYLPINQEKRRMYWGEAYPLGIADVDLADIIDLDEMGLFLESTNRKFGKTLRGLRADDKGAYNRGVKMNFLAAISGDGDDPMRWHVDWIGEGTTVERFLAFMEMIVGDLADRYPGRSFCFTMDNLNVHKNPAVVNAILNNGHRFVFRAPYYAVDGAIEYVFNTIHTGLLSYYNTITTMDELSNATALIFGNIPTFVPYFQHVGF